MYQWGAAEGPPIAALPRQAPGGLGGGSPPGKPIWGGVGGGGGDVGLSVPSSELVLVYFMAANFVDVSENASEQA